MSVFLEVLRTMRPHQWVKNVFVVAPLVFAEHAGDTVDLARAAAAFFLFSMLSGAVYILNDLMDVDGDRAHPVKRERPIASGRLAVSAARLALGIVLLGAVAASFALSIEFAAVGLFYFTLNVGYSFAFKHVPFVDVLCIAAGFILRLYGGAQAIGVPVSPWIFVCTFLLACYLALGKRKHELVMVDSSGAKQRKVLDRYDLEHVKPAMTALAVLTAASYATYTLVGTTSSSFDPRDLVWTIPFVIFGLGRFQRLTNRRDDGRSPTDLMLADPLFIANVVLWGAVVVLMIYVL